MTPGRYRTNTEERACGTRTGPLSQMTVLDEWPRSVARSGAGVSSLQAMKTLRTMSRLAALALASLGESPVRAQAPQYVVQDLGTLGGQLSFAQGVNNVGQVVGRSTLAGETVTRAFLFSGGTMIDIGTLGGLDSVAVAINDAGQIAGYADRTGDTSTRAYVRPVGGPLTDLGTLGGTDSIGAGINVSGQVAGWANLTANAGYHAFRSTGGVMTDLGTLGGTNSVGHGINSTGQVTGWAQTSGGALHAYVTVGGSMIDLGTLGGSNSIGLALNNAGLVTGQAHIADGTNRAFLYAGGSLINLGSLGGTFSEGLGINSAGQIAGASRPTGDTAQRGILYTGGVMYDLNDLVSGAQGATNIDVTNLGNHINDRAQIAAQATVGGQTHAILMTPRNMGTSFSGGLGDLAGGTFNSVTRSLANGGAAAVGSGRNAVNSAGFVWTLTGGTSELGAAAAGFPGEANSISADGRYAVGAGDNGGARNAFRYDRQTSTMTQLGTPVGYNERSILDAVSADGSRAAGHAQSAANLVQPFLWSASGGWQGLGWLPGSPNQTGHALGISGDGATVVGQSTSANSGAASYEAFRWTQADGMVGLGDLAGGGAFYSVARSTSGDGSVIIGESSSTATPDGNEAFRWTQATGMVGLGDFAGGLAASSARGISSDGKIIVGYGYNAAGQAAAVWDTPGGMRHLQSVLSSEYGVEFAGWTLRNANAISPDGRSVGGVGTDPLGNTQAWMAQINSRTYRFVSGETYAGFHTSKLGGLGTTVDLLGGIAGGTAGSFRTVTVDLLAMPTVQFPMGFASDVVDVSGTGTDTFVLQLGYDEATAIALYGTEALAELGWFDVGSNSWKNAVLGNTGGVAQFVGDRAWQVSDTLGSYGVDTANNQVWAVINHNSQFATVPEPGSAGLLVLGAGLLGFRRRRRS